MRVAVTCECGHVTEPDTHDVSHEPTHASPQVDGPAIRFCSQCGRSLAAATPLLNAPPVDTSLGPRTFQQLWQSRLNTTAETTAETPSGPDLLETTLSQKALNDSVDSTAEIASSGRRSLWAVMSGGADPSHKEDRAAEKPSTTSVPDRNLEVAPSSHTTSATNAAEPSKPKGLWSVMSASMPVAAAPATVSEPQVDPISPTSNDKFQSTSSIVQAAPPNSMTRPMNPVATATQSHGTTQPSSTSSSTAQPIRPSLLGLRRLSAGPIDETEDFGAEWSWQAIAALVLGIAAVLLAALSLKPGWLVRLPSLAVGIIALMVGFTAIGDVQRARGQLKGRFAAVIGIVLGALGLLLAPMLFARLGDSWRENSGREVIATRLRQIGTALDQHHTQHSHFPPAVIYSKRVNAKQPLHGWMTSLLPFLGHEPTHRRIDLIQPFDSPTNIAPMQQIIPEFLIPGRKPVRSQRGLGLTHFAGVGGEVVNEQVGLMHLGIFAEEGAVRREQITDGLAQTIVVGEIVDPLPAWGEPGNLRSIGNGLNKQFHGFGNPAGTGATFLHGDGSVKFYSNKTDRRLLQQLETRDGGN